MSMLGHFQGVTTAYAAGNVSAAVLLGAILGGLLGLMFSPRK
jgi:hypothetical protein